jgi:hypothetical protein
MKKVLTVIIRHRVSPSASPMTGSADNPVFRDVGDQTERRRRTGYPAFAGYDGLLWSNAMPHWRPSSSAHADDPVFRGVGDQTERPRRTGYPAFAGYDGLLWSSAMAHCRPSSSAHADDPVLRDVRDQTERPRRTGYPAFAGYDGLLWSSAVPHCSPSSSAKADDPVFRGVGDQAGDLGVLDTPWFLSIWLSATAVAVVLGRRISNSTSGLDGLRPR